MGRGGIFTIVCILILSIVVNTWAFNNIRWCRARVRACSRKQFTALVSKKLEEIANKTRTAGPTPVTGSPVSNPNSPVSTIPAVVTTTPKAARRRRQADNPSTTPSQAAGTTTTASGVSGSTTPGGGSTPTGATEITTTVMRTTDAPNVSIPPPKVYRPEDWEETFFKCLDDWRVREPVRCKAYTMQRCNWNDGQSTVLPKYCRKWNVPCRPCEMKG